MRKPTQHILPCSARGVSGRTPGEDAEIRRRVELYRLSWEREGRIAWLPRATGLGISHETAHHQSLPALQP